MMGGEIDHWSLSGWLGFPGFFSIFMFSFLTVLGHLATIKNINSSPIGKNKMLSKLGAYHFQYQVLFFTCILSLLFLCSVLP